MVQKSRKVIWSTESLVDKQEIFSYWNDRNKSTFFSKKLNKILDEKALQIAKNPFVGRKTSKENIRTVIVRDCLLIYEVFNNHILISAVWEAHQNPEKLKI